MSKEFAGSIRFSRISSNQEDDYMQLTLEDTTTSRRVLQAKIPMAEFAQCITSSSADCLFSVYGDMEKLGWTRETKTESVYIKYIGHNRAEREACELEALGEFEVDGWKGRKDDAGNQHRRLRNQPHDEKGEAYGVLFSRLVPPKEIA